MSGVACSFRGHNPPTYVDEMQTLARSSKRRDWDRIRDRPAGSARRPNFATGFRISPASSSFLPAVSGATAVENALKVALVAQSPKRHILALKAGFGGKTLLRSDGHRPILPTRSSIDPLYADVHYVDPFAPDAVAQIDALLEHA